MREEDERATGRDGETQATNVAVISVVASSPLGWCITLTLNKNVLGCLTGGFMYLHKVDVTLRVGDIEEQKHIHVFTDQENGVTQQDVLDNIPEALHNNIVSMFRVTEEFHAIET